MLLGVIRYMSIRFNATDLSAGSFHHITDVPKDWFDAATFVVAERAERVSEVAADNLALPWTSTMGEILHKPLTVMTMFQLVQFGTLLQIQCQLLFCFQLAFSLLSRNRLEFSG